MQALCPLKRYQNWKRVYKEEGFVAVTRAPIWHLEVSSAKPCPMKHVQAVLANP